jgi:bis(5'-nucleosyl)-tetraphosphatase (symmetrical)
MATYAIGDLQGCYQQLLRLLERLAFDAAQDRLWFVGDLVNRGPDSLDCLRFVRGLGDDAISVLGNHDLHLLTVAEGYARHHRGDTLQAILAAPDRDELLSWLRRRPLIHVEGQYALLHAGLLPSWSINKAQSLAREVEAALRAPNYREFIAAMYGNQPDRWDDSLTGFARLRVITNAFTRLRFCTPDGRMEFAVKGELASAPPGYIPWFDAPDRASADHTIICGHWSALGLKNEPNLLVIDTGCLWGRELTAVRLQDRALFQVSCAELRDQAGSQ